MLHKFNAFLKDQNGATAIEYSIIASLVAAALVIGSGPLVSNLNRVLNAFAGYIGATAP
ncbi:pilus assembly protein Flp/PilA [Cohaesibacter marisflavi]|uniref:Pilus assembly protein Flp/PilA n=1 Tax=Cohaesibacter marisflavi TaxID=655353 RepID=A0A1I5N2E4_9HYPH|nr:Flp family type IVb pilin [Cohaesibacter marisflavi]SFP15944.1 pilus assembly protein Flp/PilA [Cohaesibacter marisflavi]